MDDSLEAVMLRLIGVVEELHDIGSSHHRTSRQPTRQNFGEARQVWCDIIKSLSASRTESKSSHDFIKDQHHTVARCDFPESGEKLTLQRNPAPRGSRGFENDSGDLFVPGKQRVHLVQIAIGKSDHVPPDAGCDTQRSIRFKRNLKSVNHVVVPAMKVAFKAQDLRAPGMSASQPQSQESGFSSGIHKSYPLS